MRLSRGRLKMSYIAVRRPNMLSKTECKQVGVLEYESQSHGSACELLYARAVFPGGGVFNLVAEYFEAVSQCAASAHREAGWLFGA